MNREQYFKELTAVLKREGFTPLPERNSRIPVEWMGRPLCRIAEDAEIRYRREDVDSAGAERACAEAMDLASTVLEYMEAMERAPLLRASGLHEDFHLLADFGGAVLAGRERENGQGYQFVTWVWDYDRQGVGHGHYYEGDFQGAKRDFAVRAGLISRAQLFTPEELTELYRATDYLLEEGPEPEDTQLKAIQTARTKLEYTVPDLQCRLEQTQSQEPQMNL